jgi:hypothetical protein
MDKETDFRNMFTPVARQQVRPGGKTHWVGGLVRHRGDPFTADCGHRHPARREARECASSMLMCDDGSWLADRLIEALS